MKIQFSLQTLIMITITAGALMGLYFKGEENKKLRGEIRVLREDLGCLDIKDPKTGWIRGLPDKASRQLPATYGQRYRFRIYVPGDGKKFRLGVQAKSDVVNNAINRKDAEYVSIDFSVSREFIVDLKVNAGSSYELGTVMMDTHNSLHSGNMMWEKEGFDKGGYGINTPDNIFEESLPFNPAQPLIFFTIKANKVKPDGVIYSTDEPGPGLMLWFEKKPKTP